MIIHARGLALIFWLIAVLARAEEPDEAKIQMSRALGQNLATALRNQAALLDPAATAEGLRTALEKEDSLSAVETDAFIRSFEVLMNKLGETGRKEAERALEQGKEFLAQNGKKEGIKTLPSGLQYKVLKEGKGQAPTSSDTVSVNYKGTLTDGTEFDSSYSRGQPATFPLTGVIKGWTEALQLMSPGAKWQLFIPPDLAYGPRGSPPVIPPNAALIFEVELLSINDAQ